MKDKDKQKNYWSFPKRLFSVILLCFFVILGQFAYLSLFPVIYNINMDEFAATRNTYSATLYAKRGTIYDKDGNTLALNVSSYTVIAYLNESRTGSSKNPLHVVDIEGTAKQLSPILNMTEEYLIKLLSKEVYQVELGPGGRGITEIIKEKIEELDLPGIDFIENFKRYYPNGNFASYVIGYAKQYEETYEVDDVKKIEYSIIGELGIESKYEEMLTGINGYLEYQKDRYGYKIPDTPEIRVDSENGANIYLTLDSNIQRFVESSMSDLAANFNPEWATITVMDAKTGKILGTSSTPSFDPNIRNITNYENPLVTNIFEPGSTMKIYTYMCAIESGKYNGADTYPSGSIKIGDAVVSDWNGKGWGTITYDKGFEFSSNVGASYITQKVITKSELKDCLSKYGFGEKTDIELPREMVGSIKFNYPIEVATASFGQGITTTAIQQLQALSIVSNNGKMLTPHIVDKIVNPNTKETIYSSKIDESKQLVKTSTVTKIKELMYNTVNGNDIGTAGVLYKIDGIDLIGKTGTAQIFDPNSKTYLSGTNDYIYSFSGIFPNDNPEIVIYAAMKKPTNSKSYGLAITTKKIVEDVATYLNIYSEAATNSNISKYKIKSYTNKNIEEVKKELEANQISAIVLGDGKNIINQYPKENTELLSHDKIILITNGKNVTMPNIIGWSKSDVKAFSDLLELKYISTGSGYATIQSIPVGTPIIKGNELNVTFIDKYNLGN